MSYIHRCMIVLAPHVAIARELVELLAGEAAANMFTTGLSATGDEPFTHYISSGMIEDTFCAVLADPALMALLCNDKGNAITVEECTVLLGACDITEDEPFVALERLGLVMLTSEQLAARAAERAASA